MSLNGTVTNPNPTGGVVLDGILLNIFVHVGYSGGGSLLRITSMSLKVYNITRDILGSLNIDRDPTLGSFPWDIDPIAGVDLEGVGNPTDLNFLYGDTGGDDYSWYVAGVGTLDPGPGAQAVLWNQGNNGPFLFTSGDPSPNKPTNPTPTNTDTGIVLLPTLSWQAG
ncbi:hypothetical protein LCGC14_3137240 [marine sediment metagenome]|uniref:Uncharacterized protein n=1 Tax=marine sediment metagenome TaxID=412755 RepID=A0A0F8YMA3_9ZZZZ